MEGQFQGIRIAGIASCVPDNSVYNKDLANESNEKIIKKQIKATGIERRCCCVGGQTAADLCYIAADRLLNQLGWNRDEIGLLIYVSSYTLLDIPSTAFLLQSKLNIGMNCSAFDINLACSGYVVGLETIGAYLQNAKPGTKALLLTGSSPNSAESGQKPDTVLLFGDSGSATAVETAGDDTFYYSQYSDGTRAGFMYRYKKETPFIMDGMEVFNFTISDVVKGVNTFLEQFEYIRDRADYFVFHQAQKYILDKIIDFCGIPAEKMLYSYREYGNNGATSIPLTICCNSGLFAGNEKKKVFLCGYGVGLSWGNVLTCLNGTKVLPVISSNETVFKEALCWKP